MGRHDVTACVLGPPRQWCPMACTDPAVLVVSIGVGRALNMARTVYLYATKRRRNEPTMKRLTKKPLALHQRQHPYIV